MKNDKVNNLSSIENVLWATDFSKESRFCLAYVKDIADKLKTSNFALYVLPKFSDWIYETAFFNDEELLKTIQQTREDSLKKIIDFSQKSDIPFTADVVEGIESEEIIRYAHEKKVNMIFVGRRGISEIEQIFIGSTTSRLIRNSDIPVFVVPKNKRKTNIERVLAPIDFSESSEAELGMAINIARQLKAKLQVVHIAEFFNYKIPVFKKDMLIKKINEKITTIAESYNYEIDKIIYDTGEPAHKIIEVATKNKIDLITMATHQRKGIEKFFLGSISEKVLMYSDIPVLILPPVTNG